MTPPSGRDPHRMDCTVDIRPGDLDDPRVIALLHEHLASLAPTAPAESRHALDLSGLRGPDIRVWCAWDGEALAGFGALKRLDATHAEVKSMRTAASHLRRGVAARLLAHMVDTAARDGITRLSLETGSMAFFAPAHRLYAAFGFVPCPPFGDYRADPNSVFLTRTLDRP